MTTTKSRNVPNNGQSPNLGEIAAAVHHQDNLEFLDDTIPKTVPYKEIKQKAAETRAKLTGGSATTTTSEPATTTEEAAAQTNGKKQKTLTNGAGGLGLQDVVKGPSNGEAPAAPAAPAAGTEDDDVQMTG